MELELEQEVIQNEKARIDLFKWKIILVSGLGAAASGLFGKNPISPTLPLALIPLVCIYVDLLCLDLTLRIAVIGRYLNLVHRANQQPSNTGYANFVVEIADQMETVPTFGATLWNTCKAVFNRVRMCKSSASAYAFGFLAQGVSTSVLSLGVFLWGHFLLGGTNDWDLGFAAAIGIASTAWSYLEYKRRTVAIEAITGLPDKRC
jgi:hypothetical protein